MLAVGTIQIATRIDEINYDELQCLQTVEDLDSFDAKDGKIVKYTGNDPKYKKGFDYMCVIENGNKTWIPIISENGQVQVDWNQIDASAVDYIKNKPDLSVFASKADLNNKADKSEIVTSYNQLTDTPVIPEMPDTSNFALKSEIPDTSQFAKKSDIPDTSNFLTRDDLPEIPSAPDLSDIRAELENKANLSLLNNKVDVDALDDYATKNDLDNLATKNDLASKANLSDIVTDYNNLSNKPTKLSDFIDDLPDPLADLTFVYDKENVTLEVKNGDTVITSIGVADFVKDGMINSVELNYNVLTITFNTDAGKQPINIDLSNIIPALDGYATEKYVDDSLDEINEALKKVVNGETPVGKEYTAGEGINIDDNVISADTTKLATKTDLEGFARWEDIPNPNLFATKEELENKADTSDIPDVSNFITRDDIPEIPDTSNFVTRAEIPTVPENVSAFNNDAGYLTEQQDLSNYATKSEIPDVSNFVTSDQIPNTDDFVIRGELPNFSEFVTTSQLADKADRNDIPDVSNFATTSQLNDKVDRNELPDWSQFATTSQLDDKANKTEIPSLTGYATEEYVDNAVANAGGSGSGNYLKLVDDLDNYNAVEGEIVKYSGESGKYIQGANYKYTLSDKNMTISSNDNYASRLVITKCDDSNFNNFHLITPYINNKLIIPNEILPVEPFMRGYYSPYTICYFGNPELNKEVIVVVSDNSIKYGTITNIDDNVISVTFENTNIFIGIRSIIQIPLRLGVIEEMAKVVYLYPSSFSGNTNAFLFYDNDKLKMLMYTRYNDNRINTPYDITGVKVKCIELTDFCKRALNIE